ncbi:MAG: DUF2878 domain-containing protein [Gammaproteobacteria bacterium]
MNAAVPTRTWIVANAVAFQCGWFACALGAAYGLAWAGTLVALLICAAHLAAAGRPGREAVLIGCAALGGFCFDSLLSLSGLVRYGDAAAGALAPHWIVALWMLFATTLNLSLRALRRRPWIAAAFGLAGGPAAYAAGEALGALTLVERAPALALLALGWALVTPALMHLAARLDGIASAQPVAPAR